MSNYKNVELFSQEDERVALAILLNDNNFIVNVDKWGLKSETFYFPVHRAIYSAIVSLYNKVGAVDSYLVSNELKNIGITKYENIDIFQYIDECIAPLKFAKETYATHFENFCKGHFTRQVDAKLKDGLRKLRDNRNKPLGELQGLMEKVFTDAATINVSSHDEEFVDLWAEGENIIRELADSEKPCGVRFPLDSFHKMYGLLGYGDCVVIAAQKKTGKSTALRFIAEKLASYDYEENVVLIIDTEMPTRQTVTRAMAAATGEKEVYFREGTFKNDSAKVAKVNKVFEEWARRPKQRIYHLYALKKDITEIENLVKRFHSRYVKPHQNFIIINDYLKLSGESTENHKEWEIMSMKANTFKELGGLLPRTIVITSIQLNEEDRIAMSARTAWFCTHLFYLKRKTPDQIYRHGEKYGNLILEEYVTRFEGEEYQKFVEINQGSEVRYIPNCINILSENFEFKDRGTYKQMINEIKANGGQLQLAKSKEGREKKAYSEMF